ncbi:hypothetical protein A7J15_11220 [Microbacterium sediminis]|uniref:Uncharacterized protein n=2 Tax=Microbacterium sediminis TaxID=904291 RepID=A0A1B9NIW2_9MICO|nr:hypothetical protein A7J15_11220 [Microbacterium sediminis]
MREEIPAGGSGADTGAAAAPRITPDDRAPVQNVGSQNDIPGVGTREGDGSMRTRDREVGGTPAARPVNSIQRPRRSARADARDERRGGKAVWWLVPAGLLGVVCIALFAASIADVGWIAWAGIVAEVVLFAALVAVALALPLGHRRSVLFASLLGAMAVVGVGIMLTIYALATTG